MRGDGVREQPRVHARDDAGEPLDAAVLGVPRGCASGDLDAALFARREPLARGLQAGERVVLQSDAALGGDADAEFDRDIHHGVARADRRP